MSQLKVDSIVPSGGVVSGANGGIIQVVQVTKTDQFATSNTKSLYRCHRNVCNYYTKIKFK